MDLRLLLLSLLWSHRATQLAVAIEAADATHITQAGSPSSCTIDATADGITLEQAQAQARAASKQCHASRCGVTVQLGTRSVEINRSLVLTALDSGTSWVGAGAELTAATDLPPSLWTAAAADSRMDPAAAHRIMALKLTAAGVPRSSYSNSDATTTCVAGASGAQTCHLGLLIAPRPSGQWRRAQPARYPDVPMEWTNSPPVNWTHTTSVPNISAVGQRAWGFEGNRPLRWGRAATEGRLFVHGFFWSLWRDARAKILSVDTAARQLVANMTVAAFEVGLNTTYYAYGPALLEELTAPGEFAVLGDTLFAIFPADCLKDGAVVCPSRAAGTIDSLVTVQDGAENISLVGLNITGSQGDGVLVYGAKNVTIERCHISNVMTGVAVEKSTNVSVLATIVGFTGLGSISMTGGDRPTLTRADYTVAGCELHDFGLWTYTYQPGLSADGVGITASQNMFRSAFHNAVLMMGNDITLDRNEFKYVVQECFDAGAIYTDRDLTFRGNEITRNFFHHIGRPGAACNNYTNCLQMAVYVDDSAGGVDVRDNIFWKVMNGFYSNHGGGNTIKNNVFVDVSMPIVSTLQCMCDYFGSNNATIYERLFAMPFRSALWTKRYPQLRALLELSPNCTHWPTKNIGSCAAAPLGNVFELNLVTNLSGPTKWDIREDAIANALPGHRSWHLNVPAINPMFLISEPTAADPACYHIGDNLLSAHPGFASADPQGEQNFTLGPDSPMWSRGWWRIPQEQIGPGAYKSHRVVVKSDDALDMQTTLLFFNDHALSTLDNVERRVGQPTLLSEYTDVSTITLCSFSRRFLLHLKDLLPLFLQPNNITLNWAFPSVLPCQLSMGRGRGYCMLYQGFTGTTAAQGWEGHPDAKFGQIAESVDGVLWAARDTRTELPHLAGRRYQNQVKPWDKEKYGGAMAESECTVIDPLATPAERYKMLLSKTKYSPNGANVTEYFTSPDAIHWTAQKWPFLWYGQQVFAGFFNPVSQRSTIISRPDGSDRRIVSHDVSWQGRNKTRPEWTLDTDSLDTPLAEVYGMPVLPYRGYFVGLPWILHPARIPDATRPDKPVISGLTGKVDAQLAFSMDGSHWERGLRTPIFSNGHPGSPTAGLVYPNSALLPREPGDAALGAATSDRDDILLYASASSVEHGRMSLDNGSASGSILTYSLRKDGWMSLYNGGGVVSTMMTRLPPVLHLTQRYCLQGTIDTRVLEWGGGNLSLNVNAQGGEVHVQVGDATNDVPLPGFSFADCVLFSGDSTSYIPQWQADGIQASGISALPSGTRIKVQIQLLNAELFSLSGNFIINRRYPNTGSGLDPGYWQFANVQ